VRKRTAAFSTYAGLALAVVLCASDSVSFGQAGNPKSQVIYLPDPTPRKTDPQLLLGDASQAGVRGQEIIEQRNAKRRQLVEWAANELVRLSERVELDLSAPKTAATRATAAANAEKIEQLARNLSTALKTP
jgi:hypothetical protein